MIVED